LQKKNAYICICELKEALRVVDILGMKKKQTRGLKQFVAYGIPLVD
jgi:hypothetical protein